LTQEQLDDIIDRGKDLFKIIDGRIDAEEKFTGTRYDITVNPDNQLYQVSETHEELVVGDIVFGWRCLTTFRKIPPLFVNTPSHLVQNYEDLRILYDGQKSIVEAALKFMDKVFFEIPATSLIYENFELIHKCLVGLEERVEALKKQEKGKLEIYQQHVDQLNGILKPLYTDSHVFFGSPKPHPFVWNKKTSHASVQIYDRGLTAAKNNDCTYAVTVGDVGWVKGVHVWFVRCQQIGCYDTIGICDEKHFKENKPLLVGVGTYPGTHRNDSGFGKEEDGVQFLHASDIMSVDSYVKCILNRDTEEFSYQQVSGKVTSKPISELHTIQLEKYYKKGIKLFPALTVCHSSKYSLVKPDWTNVWNAFLPFYHMNVEGVSNDYLRDIRFIVLQFVMHLVDVKLI